MQCLFNSLHGFFFFDFWGVMVYYYNVMKDIYTKILLTIAVICLVLLTLKFCFPRLYPPYYKSEFHRALKS
jgi:hypothetical protein